MKNVTFVLVSCFAMLSLSACATTGMNAKNGFAVIGDRTEALSATNATGGSKVGEACATNILGIFASGDSSVAAAKKAGGIKTVSSVDVKTFNVFTAYGETCTIVRGE